MKKSIIIVGMGSGLSMGIARKFGNEGFQIGMISRTAAKLFDLQSTLKGEGIESFFETADVADTNQLIGAIQSLEISLGRVDVLQYNAVDYRYVHILDENVDDLTRGFRVSVGNALAAFNQVHTELHNRKGAMLVTGGGSANFPNPDMATVSLGKAGVRNLALQLHRAVKEDGIYVGTLTINNAIAEDSATHNPTILAEKFWELYTQRERPEMVY